MTEQKPAQMAEQKNQYTLIGLILFIACGVMIVVIIAILVKRQIMRFALKSKTEQHVSICYDVPKKMKYEARRRLERTKEIVHEPNLLNNEAKKHSNTATDFDGIPHLYRMKALDHCKLLEAKLTKDKSQCRTAAEEFDMFLRNHIHSIPVQIPESKMDEFYKLYRHARHEPKPFGRESYNRMVAIVTEMSNAIQGARILTVQSPAIRPIADISEMTDEHLPPITRTPSSQFAYPIRQTVIGLAGRVFKKSKSKQEYQSVPSTESIDDINETSPL